MYYVYYHDDYADNGGVGFEECATKREVVEFIGRRLKAADDPDIERYQVVEGRRLAIKAVEVATRIKIDA